MFSPRCWPKCPISYVEVLYNLIQIYLLTEKNSGLLFSSANPTVYFSWIVTACSFDPNIELLFLIIIFCLIFQGVEWPPCIERVTQPSVAVKARHKSEGRQVQGVNFYEHFIQRLHPVGSSFWKLGLLNVNSVGVIHIFVVSHVVVFKKRPAWPIQSWTCTAFTWRISFLLCRVLNFWVCPERGP